MSVVEAVERDLTRFTAEARDSGLAATALALAGEIDGNNSATSKSMCAKALVDVMRELRSLAPPAREKDGVDDLIARREKRRGRSAAKSSARP